jgi:hypothetical protein
MPDYRLTPDRLQAMMANGLSPRRYPETRQEWLDLYQRRHEAYYGEPYSVDDMKTLHLFRALDDDGGVLAETRRLTRDVQYVADTHVDAILAEGLTLTRAPNGDASDLANAEAIWDRSGLDQHLERYVRDAAVLGDLHFEAILSSDGTGARVVAYDPQHTELTYDSETGTRLKRAIVTVPYFEPPKVDSHGNITEAHEIMRIYRRVISPGRIDVYRDSVHMAAESGANALQVPTAVHSPYIPYRIPEYGLSAAHKLDDALSLIDSMLTQIHAIGTRHGNPLMQSAGGNVPSGSELNKLGRVINGPPGWSMSYVEPTFQGISTLLSAIQTQRETLRETMPEFLFTESGANSSGSALNFRATQFVSKMKKIRSRVYRALAEAIQIGIALERGGPMRAGTIAVEGGDILPANVIAMLEELRIAHGIQPIKPSDVVRVYQRAGIVRTDEDPETYAAETAPAAPAAETAPTPQAAPQPPDDVPPPTPGLDAE